MVYERPLRPDELMHFGVKGMKWGVRKRRENANKFFSRTNSYKTQYDLMRERGASRKQIRAAKRSDKKSGKYSVNTGVAKARRAAAVTGVGAGLTGAGYALSKAGGRGSKMAKVGSALMGAGIGATTVGTIGLANAGRHMNKAGAYHLKKKKRR